MEESGLAIPLLVGERYDVRAEIGHGGAASVYLGWDRQEKIEVAIKFPRAELAHYLGHQRFLREIKIASSLRHEHIMPILDFGESNGRLWYVMPHISGGTLRDRLIREPQLRTEDAAAITLQIASALAHAHAHGFVHRDVKPENILMYGERTLLGDFGLARSIDLSMSGHLTSTGVVVGTPAYMSPEQASGGDALDARSDVYSLGCVVYEMLAGVPPFFGPTAQNIIAQRFTHAPRPIAVYRATVPSYLEQLVEASLSLAPADRPSILEFIERLNSRIVVAAPMDVKENSKVSQSGFSVRSKFAGWSVLATVTLIAVSLAWIKRPTLDSSKVVMFTPATSEVDLRSATAPLPSLFIEALGEVVPMKWEEGDRLLSSPTVSNPREMHAERIRAAKSVHARFMLDGELFPTNDSIVVSVRLLDVASDSVIKLTRQAGARSNETVASLTIAAYSRLLPSLLDPGRAGDLDAITRRNPAAVASFILAEREFRQSRYAPALRLYEAAFSADSNLAIAALKGARSARSLFREAKARRLTREAVERDSSFHGVNRHFARGLYWLYRIESDSALRELQQAIALFPASAELNAALGDVYYYLGHDDVNSDSISELYYQRAHSLDAALTPAMYYLMWHTARRKDVSRTRLLIKEYATGGSPDTTVMRALTIASDCASAGVSSAEWKHLAETNPTALTMSGKMLIGGAADLACATASFRALAERAPEQPQLTFAAAIGMNAISVLAANPRLRDFPALRERGNKRTMDNLLLLASLAGDTSNVQSISEAMYSDRHARAPDELWILGSWFAAQGKKALLDTTISTLDSIEQSRNTSASAKLGSLKARRLLLRGDTTTAVALLERPDTSATFQEMEWLFFESKAADNVLLAQIAARRGDVAGALRFTQRLERPHSLTNALFLRAALELRKSVSEQAGNDGEARRLEARIVQLSSKQ